jgi:hypothetical protein
MPHYRHVHSFSRKFHTLKNLAVFHKRLQRVWEVLVIRVEKGLYIDLNFFFITAFENGRPTMQLSSMCLKMVTFYGAFCMNEYPLNVSGREKYEAFKTPASSCNSFGHRNHIILLPIITVTWPLNGLPRNGWSIHSTGKSFIPPM